VALSAAEPKLPGQWFRFALLRNLSAMTQFATEFPVKLAPNRASFVAQVVAWLRGTSYSKVLEEHHDADLEGETVYLRSRNGEELRLREYGRDGCLEAIGFRYDFPDNEGRLWRSEAVLRGGMADDQQSLIRFRTQCVAREAGARLDMPRKPYLVKTILSDGWGGLDGSLDVTDQPLWLADDERSLSLACAITRGDASRHLPVIYVSAVEEARWTLSKVEIDKLAYDLGGIVHVVVEPSRVFSFRLRDETDGSNAYGGTLGIGVPGHGIVRRFYVGWRLPNSLHLVSAVRSASLALQSQMPAAGWDWTELQEQALRRQRERDRNRLTAEESEQLYREEIENLQERIRELESQRANRLLPEVVDDGDDEFIAKALTTRIGPEIYPGEFSDRLRAAAALACKMADRTGLDRRSRAIFESIVKNLPSSPGLSELLEDLARATKDPKRVTAELKGLLRRHGYQEKSANKHVRLEASKEYAGLDAITLPKTPSDNRGLKNLRNQIERTLGIAKLSE
jgi:hypothetical protein